MTAIGNRLYPAGREAFATAGIDWTSDPLGVVACDDGYTYSDAHDNLNDVAGGARVFSFTPTGPTAPGGVLDLDDHTEPVLPAGDTVTRLLIYLDTGVEATSTLIAYIDTQGDSTPLAVATTGFDFHVVWPNGPTRIVRL